MSGVEIYAPREVGHRRTWTAAVPFLAFVFIAAQIIAFLVTIPFGLDHKRHSLWETVLALVAYGITASLILLWVRRFERRGLSTIGINAKGLLRYVRGLLLGFVSITSVVGLIWIVGGYQYEHDGLWQNPTPLNLMNLMPLGVIFLGFVVQAGGEEIMMRGWILQVVTSRHGVALGIIVNVVLFALLHLGNIAPSYELALSLVNMALFAAFLCFYAIRESSIWGVCAWHCAWNWLMAAGFGLQVSGTRIDVLPLLCSLKNVPSAPWWITGGEFGPEGSIATTFVLLIGITYFVSQQGNGKKFSDPAN